MSQSHDWALTIDDWIIGGVIASTITPQSNLHHSAIANRDIVTS
jgi:hypothetical protein